MYLMAFYVLYFQVFSFKPNMILLMLYLILIKCLKRQYFQSNFEHLDGCQFHFHPLAV